MINELEIEINKIKYELSVTIPEELQLASSHGDMLDNSEYSEILNRQSLLSIRLEQLVRRRNSISNISLKDIPKDRIGIGSIVTLECLKSGATRELKLIGTEISDKFIDIEEITLRSPLGKELLNKRINDEFTVQFPSGRHTYKIIKFISLHQQ